MTNNDILRRIRYTFDFNDKKMINVFALADYPVTREQVSDWLKQDDDPAFQECEDLQLATFLNGLIIFKRGKKDGPQPEPEKVLNNNIIFRKLKIAFDMQAEDILKTMELANFSISKHELSAFFRKQGHKHYRECKEQILRKFLKGAQLKYRSSSEPESESKIEESPKPESVWNSRPKPKSIEKPKPKSVPKPKVKAKPTLTLVKK